jgi:hypothetical protein
MILLLISKIFPVTLFRAFAALILTLKRLQEHAFGFEISYQRLPWTMDMDSTFTRIFPAFNEEWRSGHWRKSTSDREGSLCKNYYVAFGEIRRSLGF